MEHWCGWKVRPPKAKSLNAILTLFSRLASVSCDVKGTTYASCRASYATIDVQATLAPKHLNWMPVPVTGIYSTIETQATYSTFVNKNSPTQVFPSTSPMSAAKTFASPFGSLSLGVLTLLYVFIWFSLRFGIHYNLYLPAQRVLISNKLYLNTFLFWESYKKNVDWDTIMFVRPHYERFEEHRLKLHPRVTVFCVGFLPSSFFLLSETQNTSHKTMETSQEEPWPLKI